MDEWLKVRGGGFRDLLMQRILIRQLVFDIDHLFSLSLILRNEELDCMICLI